MRTLWKTSANVWRDALRCAPAAFILTALVYLNRSFTVTAYTYVSAQVFELAGDSSQIGLFWMFVAVYLGTYLLRRVMEIVQSFASDVTLTEKLRHWQNTRLAEKMAGMRLIAYEKADVLDEIQHARECVQDDRSHALATRWMNFLACVLGAGGIITVLAGYHIALVPLSVLSVLPLLVMRLIRGRQFYMLKRKQAGRARERDSLFRLFSNPRSAKEMRAFGSDGYVEAKWIDANQSIQAEIWKHESKDAWALLGCNVFKAVCYGGGIAVSLWLVLRGQLSIGQFGACLMAFTMLQDEAEAFIFTLTGVENSLPFARAYYDLLGRQDEDEPDEEKGITLEGAVEGIELSNVRFTYPGSDSPAVHDVSLCIRRGERIAIIGENGSGKSTLVHLLQGIYQPDAGAVLYNGQNARVLAAASVRRHLSAAQQAFVRYQLTLRENVAISEIGRIHDDARIQNALDSAGFTDAPDMAGGLDGQLGRDFSGSELSGGQWQKLAIARGLFRQCDVLFFDEPTAALDPIAEAEILHDFLRSVEERTAVIVSHRVGLCTMVDRIAVMDGGRLAEMGTHQELLEKRGLYHRFYTAQQKWYQ